MVLGNVNYTSLVTIWQEVLDSSFFQSIKKPESRTGYCHSCRYVAACKGCRSRTFVLTEDWFASDPVCPLQKK
jgi:radical SAM protein with 4Fe4S-binding SPASM domain